MKREQNEAEEKEKGKGQEKGGRVERVRIALDKERAGIKADRTHLLLRSTEGKEKREESLCTRAHTREQDTRECSFRSPYCAPHGPFAALLYLGCFK